MSTTRDPFTAPRIYNVRILDMRGDEVADVDARSTCEALAYFLTSRGIDPTATADGIAADAGLAFVFDLTTARSARVSRSERSPITGVLESCYVAEVH